MAHDALPSAAAQAAELISGIHAQGEIPKSLVYEYNIKAARWHPSYVILEDGRLISDQKLLIAVEQLPNGLSLGLKKIKG